MNMKRKYSESELDDYDNSEEENAEDESCRYHYPLKKMKKKKKRAKETEYCQEEESSTKLDVEKDKIKINDEDEVKSNQVHKKKENKRRKKQHESIVNDKIQIEPSIGSNHNWTQEKMQKKRAQQSRKNSNSERHRKVINEEKEEQVHEPTSVLTKKPERKNSVKKKKTKNDTKTKNSTKKDVVKQSKKKSCIENDKEVDVATHLSKSDKEIQQSACIFQEKWLMDTQLKKKLKKKGVILAKGNWSRKEEQLLKANMDTLLKEMNISDPRMLLFSHETEDGEQRKYIEKMKSDVDFYRRLGQGINRALFNVYRKARRIFDEKNYLGRFSEEEKEELVRLHALHGNQWAKIGKIMGRSCLAVNHKFLNLKDRTYGEWSREEENRLVKAVHTLTDPQRGESLLHWGVVAVMVETRNAEQCRCKWLNQLCWRNSEQTSSSWSKADEVKLIERVYQSDVSQECDINWKKIAEDWDRKVIPQFLRFKWFYLKNNKVHNVQNKDFKEILEYLHSNYGEELRNFLEHEND